jgi:hypothetical protein
MTTVINQLGMIDSFMLRVSRVLLTIQTFSGEFGFGTTGRRVSCTPERVVAGISAASAPPGIRHLKFRVRA